MRRPPAAPAPPCPTRAGATKRPPVFGWPSSFRFRRLLCSGRQLESAPPQEPREAQRGKTEATKNDARRRGKRRWARQGRFRICPRAKGGCSYLFGLGDARNV